MGAQIQITVRDMPHSPALETEFRRRLARVERINLKITAFRLTPEAPAHHNRNGAYFSARRNVRMPGVEIALTPDQEGVYIAQREALRGAPARDFSGWGRCR